VWQKLALVVVALAAAGGLVAWRVADSGSEPAPVSAKTSSCGAVGLPAKDLSLGTTRTFTLCLRNAERARHGLPALQPEVRLEEASQLHSEDMVRRGYFEHDTPDGVDPQQRMLEAGYPANDAFTGENIARGRGAESSPVEIVDAWMHSPPHRDNILRPGFREIGVGVRAQGDVALYTTDFGGPPQL
jgi:uncharacterized protein YkwD